MWLRQYLVIGNISIPYKDSKDETRQLDKRQSLVQDVTQETESYEHHEQKRDKNRLNKPFVTYLKQPTKFLIRNYITKDTTKNKS